MYGNYMYFRTEQLSFSLRDVCALSAEDTEDLTVITKQ